MDDDADMFYDDVDDDEYYGADDDDHDPMADYDEGKCIASTSLFFWTYLTDHLHVQFFLNHI